MSAPQSGEHARVKQRAPKAARDLMVMTDKASQAAIRGFLTAGNGQAEEWQKDQEEDPVYQDGNGVELYTRTASGGRALGVTDIDAAWGNVLGLDDRHVSTFLAAVGLWLERSNYGASMDSVRIYAGEILAMRGAEKHHKGGYRREQKGAVADELIRLAHVWVRFTDEIYEDRPGRRKGTKLVNVDEQLLGVALESECLPGTSTPIPYAFRVRLGEWAKLFLRAPNLRTGLFPAAILRRNLRTATGRYAQRIGTYLAVQWRIRAAYGTLAQPWTVRALLNGASLPLPPTNDPGRFREYVEDALDALQDDGVIRWQYVDATDDDLPAQGWLPVWLGRRVAISPATTVTEHYRLMPGRRTRNVNAAKSAGRRRKEEGT